MNPSLMSQLTQSMASGGSPMNVQTPGSAGYQPQLQQPTNPPMPDKSYQVPQGQMPPQGGQQPMVTLPIQDQDQAQPGVQVPQSEAELIIKALDGRMKALSKIHTMQTATMYPQPQVEGV